MSLIDCIHRPESATPSYFSLSLIGSQGAAYADDHRNVHLLLNEDGNSGLLTDQGELYYRDQVESYAERKGLSLAESGRAHRLEGEQYEPS